MVTTQENPSRKNFRRNSLLQFAALLVVLVLINVISSFLFLRFDLTAEKRFTLSSETKTRLLNLKDVVYVKVYLEGDLPPAYNRLRNAVKELLGHSSLAATQVYTHNSIARIKEVYRQAHPGAQKSS